jgi:hypothetical protein
VAAAETLAFSLLPVWHAVWQVWHLSALRMIISMSLLAGLITSSEFQGRTGSPSGFSDQTIQLSDFCQFGLTKEFHQCCTRSVVSKLGLHDGLGEQVHSPCGTDYRRSPLHLVAIEPTESNFW